MPETKVVVNLSNRHLHVSQAVPGSVLWRRLELLGDREHLRLTPSAPVG